VKEGRDAGPCDVGCHSAIDAAVVGAAGANRAGAISSAGRGVDGSLGLEEAINAKEGVTGVGRGSEKEGDCDGEGYLKHD